jgi:hypothetical protein
MGGPSHSQGDGGAGERPSRGRRQQRLAAAKAHDRIVRDAKLRGLVGHYQRAYEQTAQALERPAAEFVGLRGSGQVASISSRPGPEQVRECFTLACRTLAVLDVDWVALLTGDELGLAVIASADHPSDLSLFIVGLTFGPPGVEPAGILVPYRVDRGTRTVTWGPARPVQASVTHGLWAEELGPTCLDRAAVGQATLEELREQNRLVANRVLLM